MGVLDALTTTLQVLVAVTYTVRPLARAAASAR